MLTTHQHISILNLYSYIILTGTFEGVISPFGKMWKETKQGCTLVGVKYGVHTQFSLPPYPKRCSLSHVDLGWYKFPLSLTPFGAGPRQRLSNISDNFRWKSRQELWTKFTYFKRKKYLRGHSNCQYCNLYLGQSSKIPPSSLSVHEAPDLSQLHASYSLVYLLFHMFLNGCQ